MSARRGRIAVLATLLACGFVLDARPLRAETQDGLDGFDTTHSLVGSYLAGRFARAENDNKEAAVFYRNALAFDPKNEQLLEQAFQSEANEADWAAAFKLAEDLVAVQPNHRMARLALALQAFKSGSYNKAEEHFKAAGGGPIGELTSALASAWVKYAENDVSGALKRLDLPKQPEWAQFYLRYHRALIADLAGKTKEARDSFEKAFNQDTRTLRTALAFARHASASGDQKFALSIVSDQLQKAQGDGHPLLRSLKDVLASGKPTSRIVTNSSEGMAEVLYGLGEALNNEGAIGVGALYLQMALFIEPAHQFALAALANAYETNKQYAEAITTFEKIPPTSPLATAVEVRKAFNLNSLDRSDEAKATLLKLLESDGKPVESTAAPADAAASPAPQAPLPTLAPGLNLKVGSYGDNVKTLQDALSKLGFAVDADGDFGRGTKKAVAEFQKSAGLKADGVVGEDTFDAVMKAAQGGAKVGSAGSAASEGGRLPLTLSDKLEILDSLGNILRGRKQFAEAIPFYDKALNLVGKPDKRHWVYYYARGTSYERIKNWPSAEADLKKALALYPDQPLILNYLGYSWVDQGLNLKEGMAYIEKAVALKPDDGYIVDSLGWAHFKLGRYKEAVRYLERAVELKPDDPVLNDHLGDALWRAGREREARYQWDQALSLKPEPEDLAKIKRKLEVGLDHAENTTAAGGDQAAQTGASTTGQQ